MKKWLRVLSVMLAIVLAISTMPIMSFAAETEAPVIWDGQRTAPTVGAGTEGDPYQLSSPSHLAYVVSLSAEETTGKYYIITKDLYMNDITTRTYSNGYIVKGGSGLQWPSGTATGYELTNFGAFAGTIDGLGHTVFGIYNEWAPNGYWGLFSQLASNATVKNINVDSAFYRRSSGGWTAGSNPYAAGIAGSVSGTNVTVENCTVYRSNFCERAAGFVNAGGIVGTSLTSTGLYILNCGADYITNIDTNSNKLGYESAGILGNNYGSATPGVFVKNCWSTRYPSDHENSAGSRVSYENCYTLSSPSAQTGVSSLSGVTTVSGSVLGDDAKTTMPNLGWGTNWVTAENANPKPIVAWSGARLAPAGEGTQANPYKITNGEELAYVVSLSEEDTDGKYFTIVNDIYLNHPSKVTYYDTADYASGHASHEDLRPWPSGVTGDYTLTKFGVFSGVIDGQGYKVFGMNNYKAPAGCWGLFSALDGTSTVKNINVDSAFYNRAKSSWHRTNTWAAGIAGQLAGGSVTIENCTVYRSTLREGIHANGYINIGGILGRNPNEYKGVAIKDCGTDIFIYHANAAGYEIGGIIGDAWTNPIEISNCWSNLYLGGDNATNGGAGATYTDCYTFNENAASWATTVSGVTTVSGSVLGDDAKTTMPNLGWAHKWVAVENANPMPRTVETACEYGEWIVDSKASSTAAGSKHKVCSLCGDVVTEAIAQIPDLSNATGEYTLDVNTTGEVVFGGEATLIVPTGSEVTVKAADDFDVTSEAIEGGIKYTSTAHVHVWGEWVIDSKASSTAAGSKHRDCGCGETETEVIAQIPDLSSAEGTYTLDVNTTGEVVLGGEAVVIVPTGSEVTIVAADGFDITSAVVEGGVAYTSTAHVHSYGDWIIDSRATSTSAGSKHKECACGEDPIVEEIPQIPDLSNITETYTLDVNTTGEVLIGGTGSVIVPTGSGVAIVVADGYIAASATVANGVKYTAVKLPNATVESKYPTVLAAGEYDVWDGSLTEGTEDLPLNIVMKFTANDTLEECIASGCSEWLCDFNIKFTGLAEGSIVADNSYLAGNYGTFGWIVIPTDGLEIEEGVTYPVVAAYDATLNYKDICNSVKEFIAAIHIDDAILEANPDMQVELSLVMTNNENTDQKITVGETEVFTVEDLKKSLPEAKVEVMDSLTLNVGEYDVWTGSLAEGTEELPLDIVMKFTAEDTLEECLAGGFSQWLCDFNIKFTGLAEGSFIADNSYLAGNYGTFGWIAIPTDGFVLEEGVSYPIVANYDATLNYKDICNSVKEFIAAIHIDDAILEANPDMQVELSLVMTNNEDPNDTMIIGEPAVFDVEDLITVAEIVETGEKYDSYAAAMNAATAGQTVKLIKDIDDTASPATQVKPGVILDLNGHYVKAVNFLSFGDVIDTRVDAAGGVVISDDTTKAFTMFQPNNTYLPIYDTASGCYRFFAYEVQALSKNPTATSPLQFGFKVLFENKSAYALIQANPDCLKLSIKLEISGQGQLDQTLEYTCDSSVLAEYASVAAESTSKLIFFTVYGTDKLNEGASLSATPTVTSVKTTVTKTGNTKTYTK